MLAADHILCVLAFNHLRLGRTRAQGRRRARFCAGWLCQQHHVAKGSTVVGRRQRGDECRRVCLGVRAPAPRRCKHQRVRARSWKCSCSCCCAVGGESPRHVSVTDHGQQGGRMCAFVNVSCLAHALTSCSCWRRACPMAGTAPLTTALSIVT